MKDDCSVIKPTILLSVPRLYNKIVDAVRTKFAHEKGVKKWLVDKAINTKLDNLEQKGEYKSGFYDAVVFSKVREGFGGKVRVMGSGNSHQAKDDLHYKRFWLYYHFEFFSQYAYCEHRTRTRPMR